MNTAVPVQHYAPPTSASNIVDGQAITIIQAKILYTLGIYPKLSRSMLQTGIGPSISPVIWTPVLEDMIARRLVQEATINVKGPGGRANSPKILSLTEDGRMLVPKDILDTEDPPHHENGSAVPSTVGQPV